jgi:hypothetical protein
MYSNLTRKNQSEESTEYKLLNELCSQKKTQLTHLRLNILTNLLNLKNKPENFISVKGCIQNNRFIIQVFTDGSEERNNHSENRFFSPLRKDLLRSFEKCVQRFKPATHIDQNAGLGYSFKCTSRCLSIEFLE